MNKDRIIALTVCSVIFVTVLILSVTTVTRGNSRTADTSTQTNNSSTTQVTANTSVAETPAPAPVVPSPPPEPPRQLRYKRSNAPEYYPEFDFSNCRQQLPSPWGKQPFKAGILVDMTNRKVLWEKNCNTPVPIASTSKLMMIYTAFELLEEREDINLKTLVTVSTECSKVAPVKINLRPGDKVKLQDLFVYSMLKSANDASHLIAEYFGYGDSSKFIDAMNKKASQIGMNSSNFVNANGLPIYSNDKKTPAAMNMASCHDMAKLIERLFEYPMILRYTGIKKISSDYGPLGNGNRLLGAMPGVDGLKTGYTNAAGHCLAFSCSRNGRRLVGIVTGFSKRDNCFSFVRNLLEWGYKN